MQYNQEVVRAHASTGVEARAMLFLEEKNKKLLTSGVHLILHSLGSLELSREVAQIYNIEIKWSIRKIN
jgi:hypothetical protein